MRLFPRIERILLLKPIELDVEFLRGNGLLLVHKFRSVSAASLRGPSSEIAVIMVITLGFSKQYAPMGLIRALFHIIFNKGYDVVEVFRRTPKVRSCLHWEGEQIFVIMLRCIRCQIRTVVHRPSWLLDFWWAQAVVKILDEVFTLHANLLGRLRGQISRTSHHAKASSPFVLGHVSEELFEAGLDLSSLKRCHLIPSFVIRGLAQLHGLHEQAPQLLQMWVNAAIFFIAVFYISQVIENGYLRTILHTCDAAYGLVLPVAVGGSTKV